MIKFSLKKFFRSFSKKEKITLSIAIVVFFIAVFGKSIFIKLVKLPMQPKPGGEITEGILAQTDLEVEKSINNLVNFSLLYFDENMTIQNGLASSYEIVDGGKKYIFTLKNGINAKDLAIIFNTHTNYILQLFIISPNQFTHLGHIKFLQKPLNLLNLFEMIDLRYILPTLKK